MGTKTIKNTLLSKFLDYLVELDVAVTSLKHYKSDVKHFVSWLINEIAEFGVSAENLSEVTPFITKQSANEYRDHLINNSASKKTVNRKLSTLRHLGKFMYTVEVVDYNFSEHVVNIPTVRKLKPNKLIRDFEAHLLEENISPNTIKSYLSDINQFMNWVKTN